MVKSDSEQCFPGTLRWMRWHKTQRSMNILTSLQVNVPDSIWLPLMARGCFLARQDRWLGTLVLTSTLWAAFHLNANEGARRPSEPGPDFALCSFVQASHCVFGAFFQALLDQNSVYGLESLRLRSPDYEYLDRFTLGLGRKMMRGKATISTKLEDGTEKKRTVDRRKVWDFLGLVPSATELHARRLQRHHNLVKDPTAHQNVLFSFFGEASF